MVMNPLRRTRIRLILTLGILILGSWLVWKQIAPPGPPRPLISVWIGPSLPCGGPLAPRAQVQFSAAQSFAVHVADVTCFGAYRTFPNAAPPILELRVRGVVTRYTYDIQGDRLSLHTMDGQTVRYLWQPSLVCDGAMCL